MISLKELTCKRWATIVLLYAANLANAQIHPLPNPTDILNTAQTPTMASGNYYNSGPNGLSPIFNTDIAGILPLANTLSLPATSLTGQKAQPPYPVNCNNTSAVPLSFIESNQGSGIKGLGFLGSFNAPSGLSYLGGNVFEAVFFNDHLCYNGGREYGFFLATFDNSVWVYWGTNENTGGVQQAQRMLEGVSANTQYYYEIHPYMNGTSCSFDIMVFLPSGSLWYEVNENVTDSGGQNIPTVDPGFCDAIASPTGDAGYVSANIVPSSYTLQGGLPASGLDLSLQRVFVGK